MRYEIEQFQVLVDKICHEVTGVNFHEAKNSLVLNSLRSRKESDHSAVKFSYLSFHDSQPRTFAFHASRNTLQSRFTQQIFIKSRFTEHKKTGSWRQENTLAAPPPPPPPLNSEVFWATSISIITEWNIWASCVKLYHVDKRLDTSAFLPFRKQPTQRAW